MSKFNVGDRIEGCGSGRKGIIFLGEPKPRDLMVRWENGDAPVPIDGLSLRRIEPAAPTAAVQRRAGS